MCAGQARRRKCTHVMPQVCVCRGCQHSSGLPHLACQSAALHALLLRFEEGLLSPHNRWPDSSVCQGFSADKLQENHLHERSARKSCSSRHESLSLQKQPTGGKMHRHDGLATSRHTLLTLSVYVVATFRRFLDMLKQIGWYLTVSGAWQGTESLGTACARHSLRTPAHQ